MTTKLSQLFEQENIPFRQDCPLAERSTFRIGGTAALAAFPQTRDQLIRVLTLARDGEVPYTVIGNASNVLFPDGEYPGLIVFTGDMRQLSCLGNEITADAGATLAALAKLAKSESLTGAEFAAGIPGTVGGAVLMNAGAFGGSMAQITVRSDYWDVETGTVGSFAGAEQKFATRSSIYAGEPRYIILGAVLRLRVGFWDEINERMEEYARRRRMSQPLGLPNAGSIFRHPPGQFAGKLIEECGLKGASVGGAAVSEKHAGFIVNRGGATAKDVAELIGLIRERVLRETGITLECEIRAVGDRTL